MKNKLSKSGNLKGKHRAGSPEEKPFDKSKEDRMEKVMEIMERIKSPFPISFGCV